VATSLAFLIAPALCSPPSFASGFTGSLKVDLHRTGAGPELLQLDAPKTAQIEPMGPDGKPAAQAVIRGKLLKPGFTATLLQRVLPTNAKGEFAVKVGLKGRKTPLSFQLVDIHGAATSEEWEVGFEGWDEWQRSLSPANASKNPEGRSKAVAVTFGAEGISLSRGGHSASVPGVWLGGWAAPSPRFKLGIEFGHALASVSSFSTFFRRSEPRLRTQSWDRIAHPHPEQ